MANVWSAVDVVNRLRAFTDLHAQHCVAVERCAIAGEELTIYLFEGSKKDGNKTLHITSHVFDEPRGRAAVATADAVVALHGECNKQDPIVFLGGRDETLGAVIRQHLEAAGFAVKKHADPTLQGVSLENICNRGRSGAGVQLELSEALRSQFFASLKAKGRSASSERFGDFVAAVRNALGLPVQGPCVSAKFPFPCWEIKQGDEDLAYSPVLLVREAATPVTLW